MRSRCAGVGSFSLNKINNYGIQGVIARASGLSVDARLGLLAPTYASYPTISFKTLIGKRGDCYDRFVVRAREMLESYSITLQVINDISSSILNPRSVSSHGIGQINRSKFVSMESVISHFKLATLTPSVTRGVSLSCVEGPKGTVGVFINETGTISRYRFHVRSPVAHNLHLLSSAANGYTFADFVATFCSLDVVLGEIDR